MPFWRSFWRDEAGAIVSAELIAVSTLGVLGGTVGMNMLSTSVDGEFRDLSHAVRSLNQSYYVRGHVSPRAWTATSFYTQRNVKESIAELDAEFVGDHAAPHRDDHRHPPKHRKHRDRKPDDEVNNDVDNQDEAAFLTPDESALGDLNRVEPEDDASQVETTIEAAP